jgi:hypothetical protein
MDHLKYYLKEKRRRTALKELISRESLVKKPKFLTKKSKKRSKKPRKKYSKMTNQEKSQYY